MVEPMEVHKDGLVGALCVTYCYLKLRTLVN